MCQIRALCCYNSPAAAKPSGPVSETRALSQHEAGCPGYPGYPGYPATWLPREGLQWDAVGEHLLLDELKREQALCSAGLRLGWRERMQFVYDQNARRS